MKKCEVCGYENGDESVYCMRCGKPLPESPEKVKEWFYVKDNKAMGPVCALDLKTMLQARTVTQNTLIWKKGIDDWIPFYSSTMFEYPSIKEDAGAAKEWFYIDDGQKMGPVTEEALKALVDTNALSQQTLVWKVGLSRWISFMDSDLFELPSIPETKTEDIVWFYTKDQAIEGPVSSTVLHDLVMNGDLSDRIGVWTYGMEDWVAYNESEIFELPELLDIKEGKIMEPTDGDWNYTDGTENYGPFNEEQIKDLHTLGIVRDDTILWQDPQNRVLYKDIDFSKATQEPSQSDEVLEVKIEKSEPEKTEPDKEESIEAEDIVSVMEEKKEKEPEPMILNLSDSVDWYIVENNESKGPFSEQDCLDMYRQGRIDDKTYVWHDLLEDWIYYKDSELASKA